MVEMYLTMAFKNMHAVEDSMIGSIFDKARYHKIPFNRTHFYYTRHSSFLNLLEMMGTPSFFRWVLP